MEYYSINVVYVNVSGIIMHTKCDDQCVVYADGDQLFTAYNSKTKNIIPRTTHVVAIWGTNWGNTASIQAAFSNGYRTDPSWRCTDEYDNDWHSKDYNDSHWDHATDYGLGNIGDGDDVRKIWTANVVNESYIYCRGHIGMYIVHSYFNSQIMYTHQLPIFTSI